MAIIKTKPGQCDETESLEPNGEGKGLLDRQTGKKRGHD